MLSVKLSHDSMNFLYIVVMNTKHVTCNTEVIKVDVFLFPQKYVAVGLHVHVGQLRHTFIQG